MLFSVPKSSGAAAFLRRWQPALIVAITLLAVACGRSPAGPEQPPTPTPTPPLPTFAIPGVVYYDENANGVPDAGEDARIPGVVVGFDGPTAQSASGTARTKRPAFMTRVFPTESPRGPNIGCPKA